MKLAIVGDRNYKDYKKFTKRVDKFIEKEGRPTLIVSGGARGIDHMAEKYAKKRKIPTKIFHADWKTFGKAAGPMRNVEIVNECTHVLAFLGEGSKGTASTIRIARNVHKPLTVINLKRL